jgi:hypothetical protein
MGEEMKFDKNNWCDECGVRLEGSMKALMRERCVGGDDA